MTRLRSSEGHGVTLYKKRVQCQSLDSWLRNKQVEFALHQGFVSQPPVSRYFCWLFRRPQALTPAVNRRVRGLEQVSKFRIDGYFAPRLPYTFMYISCYSHRVISYIRYINQKTHLRKYRTIPNHKTQFTPMSNCYVFRRVSAILQWVIKQYEL